MRSNNKDIHFIIKASLFYCAISFSFSFLSIFLPEKTHLVATASLGALSAKEILVHFLFGIAAAALTLRLKYLLLGGVFAVLIDADHIIDILQIEGISRMAHSPSFAIISAIIMIFVFGKKDYLLGAIAGASVLSHISYDLFVGPSAFPFFTPIYNIPIAFASIDWIYFEMAAIAIIGIVTIFVKEKILREQKLG